MYYFDIITLLYLLIYTLGSSSGENDLDAILARAEAASEKLKSINWGAYEYDFGLEKSVIEQDITATMKRHGMKTQS